jgi:hypothetical protein
MSLIALGPIRSVPLRRPLIRTVCPHTNLIHKFTQSETSLLNQGKNCASELRHGDCGCPPLFPNRNRPPPFPTPTLPYPLSTPSLLPVPFQSLFPVGQFLLSFAAPIGHNQLLGSNKATPNPYFQCPAPPPFYQSNLMLFCTWQNSSQYYPPYESL